MGRSLFAGTVIELPKSDKRYKVGNIAKDKKGRYRGNPKTVQLRRMELLRANTPMHLRLNPPVVATEDLVRHLDCIKYKREGI